MQSPVHILLIENDARTRELLRDFLTEHGFAVLQAEDGLQGVDVLQQKAVDLLIVHTDLPYVSGIGLVQLVRERYAGLPVICMTGGGAAEEVTQQENPDAMLPQPFTPDELLQAVQRLLPDS